MAEFRLNMVEIAKSYKAGVPVLADISAEFSPGLSLLIGANGVGKTTLLRILAGVMPPDNGKVMLNGKDIGEHIHAYKRNTGYVPQETGFYSEMTVKQFLAYMAQLKGISWKLVPERTLEIAEYLRLQNIWHKRIGRLSSGWKRRLAVAQAILNDPDVLILDEPLSGLDLSEKQHLTRLLRQMAQERIVLLCSHVFAAIEVNEIVFLANGRFAFKGSPERFLAAAVGRVWQVNVSAVEWAGIKHRYTVSEVICQQEQVQARVISATAPELPEVYDLQPTMEDAYIYWKRYLMAENKESKS